MGICVIGIGAEVPFAEELRRLVSEEFGGEVTVGKKIPMDDGTYDVERKQYDAEKLLAYLAGKQIECGKIFGICKDDLFVQGLNFVFGLSELGGREGVLSFARLNEGNEAQFNERFLKEALHELGHLHGLKHCTSGRCVMKFSNSLHEVDRKGSSFCAKCKERL